MMVSAPPAAQCKTRFLPCEPTWEHGMPRFTLHYNATAFLRKRDWENSGQSRSALSTSRTRTCRPCNRSCNQFKHPWMTAMHALQTLVLSGSAKRLLSPSPQLQINRILQWVRKAVMDRPREPRSIHSARFPPTDHLTLGHISGALRRTLLSGTGEARSIADLEATISSFILFVNCHANSHLLPS